MNKPLRAELEPSLQDPGARLLCRSILGTDDSRAIAQTLTHFCSKRLGSQVTACLCLGFSVGASFGLGLADGRLVFVKVNKPSEYLDLQARGAIAQVQEALASGGYPCPSVILPPSEFLNGFVTVDAFVADGEQKDAHEPRIRESMAAGLAELIARTEPYRTLPGFKPLRFVSQDRLYPPPHNVLFDFEKTAAGAGWIDEIARRSRAAVFATAGKMVLGHMDWSMKNLRFEGDRIAVVYDWDSLTLVDELVAVGAAAATFPTTWDIDVKITPSQQESCQFVMDYQLHRGKRFTAPEMFKIAGAATYAMAYTARCEHALLATGGAPKGEVIQALESMIGDNYLNV